MRMAAKSAERSLRRNAANDRFEPKVELLSLSCVLLQQESYCRSKAAYAALQQSNQSFVQAILKAGSTTDSKVWTSHGECDSVHLCLVTQEERLGCYGSDGGARSIS